MHVYFAKYLTNALFFFLLHWVLVVACGLSSSLQHAESLVVALGVLVAAHGIWFPEQGSNLGLLH